MKSSDKDILNVLFVDNHVLVVDKPAGLSTQPHHGDSLEERAKAWVKRKYEKKGNVFLTPVHRLDTPVRGIVLFARTSKSLSRLNEAMRFRQIQKTYRARIEGHLKEKKGELIHFLLHKERHAEVSKEGKKAHLSYCTLKEMADSTLVEVDLHTGRYHQIRAQFAAIGHPICGDVKYGAKKQKQEGIDLHHAKLSFPHPITKERITISSN